MLDAIHFDGAMFLQATAQRQGGLLGGLPASQTQCLLIVCITGYESERVHLGSAFVGKVAAPPHFANRMPV